MSGPELDAEHPAINDDETRPLLAEEQEAMTVSCSYQYYMGKTILILTLGGAGLYSSIQYAFDLKRLQYSSFFAYSAAILAFFTATGLNAKVSLPGSKDILVMLEKFSLPSEDKEEWPDDLPPHKEVLAFILSLFITSASAYYISLQSHDFLKGLPQALNKTPKPWQKQLANTASIILPTSLILNLIFGQGLETFKIIRQCLSKQTKVKTGFADIFGLIMGHLLGLNYVIALSLSDLYFTYMLEKTAWTGMPLLGHIIGLSCLNTSFAIDTIRRAEKTLSQEQKTSGIDRAGLLISAVLSLILAYTQSSMIKEPLEQGAKLLGQHIGGQAVLNAAADVLSTGYALAGLIVMDTETLRPVVTKATSLITQGAQNLFNFFTQKCSSPQEEAQPSLNLV